MTLGRNNDLEVKDFDVGIVQYIKYAKSFVFRFTYIFTHISQ